MKNIFNPKQVKIVSNYVAKDRVDTNEIRRKLHPLNLNGKAPDKKRVDELNKVRMENIKRGIKKWK